jgi:hypothetical protein
MLILGYCPERLFFSHFVILEDDRDSFFLSDFTDFRPSVEHSQAL